MPPTSRRSQSSKRDPYYEFELARLKRKVNSLKDKLDDQERHHKNSLAKERGNTRREVEEKLKWKREAYDNCKELAHARESLVRAHRLRKKIQHDMDVEKFIIENDIETIKKEHQFEIDGWKKNLAASMEKVENLKIILAETTNELIQNQREVAQLNHYKDLMQQYIGRRVPSLEIQLNNTISELHVTVEELAEEKRSNERLARLFRRFARIFVDEETLQMRAVEAVLPVLQRILRPRGQRDGNQNAADPNGNDDDVPLLAMELQEESADENEHMEGAGPPPAE